jgi:hypothetical protein
MNIKTHSQRMGSALPHWCRGICFALIILLIHNPYLVAPAMAGGLHVSHLPSYRATIAASELQHFTPSPAQHAVIVQAGPRSSDLDPLQPDGRQPRFTSSQVVSRPQRFLSADLWFRPPPVS